MFCLVSLFLIESIEMGAMVILLVVNSVSVLNWGIWTIWWFGLLIGYLGS